MGYFPSSTDHPSWRSGPQINLLKRRVVLVRFKILIEAVSDSHPRVHTTKVRQLVLQSIVAYDGDSM